MPETALPYGPSGSLYSDPTPGPFITIAELGVQAQETIAPDDAFALWICEAASDLVRDTAGMFDWDTNTVPFRAKLIALLVAKRTWLNPESKIAKGVGPLTTRYADREALGMWLSLEETAALVAMGDGAAPGTPTLGVIKTTRGAVETHSTEFRFDDSGSDWAIPYGAAEEWWLWEPPA